jgi:hypothetical protein
MASYSEIQEINSKSTHKGKPQLRSIELERAANGGFIATHRFNNAGGPYKEPETHTFGKDEGAKLIDHLGSHFGLKSDKDSAAGAAS